MLEKYGGLHLRASGVRSCILGLIETTISGHGRELSVSIHRNYNHVEEYVPVIVFGFHLECQNSRVLMVLST
jgi:hypothetical protein